MVSWRSVVARAACLAVGLGAAALAAQTSGAAQSQERVPMKLKPVPFTQVKIQDSFWAPRREVDRKVSLSHSLDMLEKAGNLRNLDRAARGEHSGYEGPVFMDSDLYKVLEAVSYSLATDPDPALEKRIDAVIAKIAAAQMQDGYLDTYYQVVEPDRRWTNLRDNHELYCAGHLIEAAVAHYQATGKRTLLDVATKVADHIARLFGDGPGQRMGYPGHPELELALVKLWKATGQQRYFDLARFFVEHRGSHFFATEHSTPADQYDGSYWQDNVPIREHRRIVGHAVRAAYLFSGVVDVAGETGDQGLLKMIDRVWRNTTERNLYVTGGIGPSASNEGFTTDYDLPNLTAYQETCASVAMVLWNHRLNLLYGDSKYADLVEQSLYNGFLSGVSLDGKLFFYVNPLASMGNHHRSEWFGCACCPPNVARTLAALGGYAYATTEDALWVNLYIQGAAQAQVGQRKVDLKVTTQYPWSGKVTMALNPDKPGRFDLRLRVPGWCQGASAKVNGQAVKASADRGYLVLSRDWKAGDKVELDLPMPVRRVQANPQVKDNAGRLAIARGPLVYCLEAVDQSVPVSSLALPPSAKLGVEKRPDLLGGVTVIKGEALTSDSSQWSGGLYQTAEAPAAVPVVAIPYYAWDNRKPGAMEVWVPTTPAPPAGGGPERGAKVSLSFTSGNAQPEGIHDGKEPKSSGEQPDQLCHFWPHKGTEEWVQYTWQKPLTLGSSRVYWFDDTGRGECRLPDAWHLEYLDGSQWKPVAAEGAYGIGLDKWFEVRFTPVTTTALRLALKMKPGWAAGLHEWQVGLAED